MSHSIHQRKTNTALATAVLATLAAAQTAGAQPVAADEATVLAEIIVTAQKREQKLQDVPIAVSVVGGDLVDTTGGYNAESLVQLVPRSTSARPTPS